MNSEFEIVDQIPSSRFTNSKYGRLHLELMKLLLQVPNGKSVRKSFGKYSDAQSYGHSLYQYIRKQKLAQSYFVGIPKNADEDGKFYVYIGKKGA
jgi:hypothetical protein